MFRRDDFIWIKLTSLFFFNKLNHIKFSSLTSCVHSEC